MNLIEYWGSGIPRIIGKVKVAGLREPEFIGGDVDLRINIYREQIEPVDDVPDTIERLPDNEQMNTYNLADQALRQLIFSKQTLNK